MADGNKDNTKGDEKDKRVKIQVHIISETDFPSVLNLLQKLYVQAIYI